MIQIDLHKIKEWVKIHFISIIIIIVLLFLLFNKNKSIDSILLENKNLKKQTELTKREIDYKLKQNKKLEKVILNYEKQVVSLYKENNSKDNDLKLLSKSNKKNLEDIKKMSEDDLTNFFKDRYSPKKDIFKTDLGIVFKDTISKQIAFDLIGYDYSSRKLDIVEKQYDNQIKITELKDSIINGVNEQKENLLFIVDQKNVIINDQENLIDNQEKIIKKQSRSKSLLKLSVPAGVLLGIGAGFLITK